MPPKKSQTATMENVFARMVVRVPEGDRLKEELARAKNELNRINRLNEDSFYGFESFDEEKDAAELWVARLKTRAVMAKKGYPELDYTFLGWRNKVTQLPAFIVLGLDNNEFTISVCAADSINSYVDLSVLPAPIIRQYAEVIGYLIALSHTEYEDDDVAITADFRGIMPKSARYVVKKALASDLFDQVLVIAEAPANWKIEHGASARNLVRRDPLIVGWVEETEQMFLITSFDPTALEKYVEEQHVK